jgi:hypothetical protein
MITEPKKVKDKEYDRDFDRLSSLIKRLMRIVNIEEIIKENRAICILNLFFLDI